MSAAIRAALVVAAAEFRAALAGRLVQGFGVVFALMALAIAGAGLAASGQVVVQGFTRTAVSLLSLALYLLPLVGLVLGAHAFGVEDGGTELLLAQPIARGTVLVGRTLGLAATLVLVAAIGFGLAGLVVLAGAGVEGLAGYALVAVGSTVVGLSGLALGVLLGVRARRRLSAVAMALVAWVVLAVLFDFGAIALLQFVGDGEPGDHTIDRCEEVTAETLEAVFRELRLAGVDLSGMLLKPNMVLAGHRCSEQPSIEEVARRTVETLLSHVPAAVPTPG